jgi:hypothetical protein
MDDNSQPPVEGGVEVNQKRWLEHLGLPQMEGVVEGAAMRFGRIIWNVQLRLALEAYNNPIIGPRVHRWVKRYQGKLEEEIRSTVRNIGSLEGTSTSTFSEVRDNAKRKRLALQREHELLQDRLADLDRLFSNNDREGTEVDDSHEDTDTLEDMAGDVVDIDDPNLHLQEEPQVDDEFKIGFRDSVIDYEQLDLQELKRKIDLSRATILGDKPNTVLQPEEERFIESELIKFMTNYSEKSEYSKLDFIHIFLLNGKRTQYELYDLIKYIQNNLKDINQDLIRVYLLNLLEAIERESTLDFSREEIRPRIYIDPSNIELINLSRGYIQDHNRPDSILRPIHQHKSNLLSYRVDMLIKKIRDRFPGETVIGEFGPEESAVSENILRSLVSVLNLKYTYPKGDKSGKGRVGLGKVIEKLLNGGMDMNTIISETYKRTNKIHSSELIIGKILYKILTQVSENLKNS